MGLFLALSGVLSGDAAAVKAAIASYAATNQGEFEPRTGTMDDDCIGILQSTAATTTILHPYNFLDWDDLSRHISDELQTPVFSFHIHDGDLWMFIAFKNGEEFTWFNPMCEYWGELEAEEQQRWSGDATAVASLVPGLDPSAIERYFVNWTEEVLENPEKAYEDDEYNIGEDWQLVDFMKRLGFAYPLDDKGEPTGETFFMKVE